MAKQAADWSQYQGKSGFEDMSSDDLALPYIVVMQNGSPQVENGECKAGDLVNSVTNEILKQPVIIIPTMCQKLIVEWRPRNEGGGMVARHPLDAPAWLQAVADNGGSNIPPKDAEGRRLPFKSPDGNDLVETGHIYALILDEKGEKEEGQGVIAFASTKMKVYRKLLTSLSGIRVEDVTPPMFANRAKLSTVKEKNQAGTYYNYAINPFKDSWKEAILPPDSPLVSASQTLVEMVNRGDVKIIGEEQQESLPSPGKDEEIPF